MFSSASTQLLFNQGLAIASITSLVSVFFSSPVFARDYRFSLYNLTGQDLREIYISPATSTEWGPNRLPETSLPPDFEALIELSDDAQGSVRDEATLFQEDCLYDVRSVLADGRVLEDYGINLCEVSLVGFVDLVDDTALYSENNIQDIFITNNSSFPLEDLVLIPLGNPDEVYFLINGSLDEGFDSDFIFEEDLGADFDNDFSIEEDLSDDFEGELINELPALPPQTTELLLVSLPIEYCEYKVFPVFSGLDDPNVSGFLNLCMESEIIVFDDVVFGEAFGTLFAEVYNNTPYSLEVLEISPSLRPELWMDVLRGSSIEKDEYASGDILNLATGDPQSDCFYDIFAIF
ncbi:MAG: hypothetical protein AAF243_05360, partial [Cyanobacteria bacterium P01_A01_bin.137]